MIPEQVAMRIIAYLILFERITPEAIEDAVSRVPRLPTGPQARMELFADRLVDGGAKRERTVRAAQSAHDMKLGESTVFHGHPGSGPMLRAFASEQATRLLRT